PGLATTAMHMGSPRGTQVVQERYHRQGMSTPTHGERGESACSGGSPPPYWSWFPQPFFHIPLLCAVFLAHMGEAIAHIKVLPVESKNPNAFFLQHLQTHHYPLNVLISLSRYPILPDRDKRQRRWHRRMDWKILLAYITGSVDQELLLRNEYLVTEN